MLEHSGEAKYYLPGCTGRALPPFSVTGHTEKHIRSDNGPEFTAKKVRGWLHEVDVNTLFIEPGIPWENGYIESFNGKLRDESLNREVFDTLLEAQVLIERWRKEYNQIRPHSSLGYRPPAPEVLAPYLSTTLTLEVVQ
jgi:transposase InsO family protein